MGTTRRQRKLAHRLFAVTTNVFPYGVQSKRTDRMLGRLGDWAIRFERHVSRLRGHLFTADERSTAGFRGGNSPTIAREVRRCREVRTARRRRYQ